MDVAEVQRLVETFDDSLDQAAAKSRELILGMLVFTPEPFSRNQFVPGHITCTGLVLNASGDRVLLVYHARLLRWLLPGGHVEREDVSAAWTARREVIEETGAVLDPAYATKLVGLDVHGIPPRRTEPFHLHHDLVFAFRAVDDAVICSPESRAAVWCGPSEFDRFGVPANVRLALGRL